ncbi:MAG: DUF480 domain-containing protein [Alteromonadaceae bacterium]|nr:DUF480 domain-containing protein [Alteromonadaceae bacterium]
MKNSLTANQCRVIGVMLEKEITTPDQYPLSLNGLTNGCNQKSAREPVMSLTENDVQNTLDELTKNNQISEQITSGSRVVKYQHRFCNTQFGDLQLTKQQLAVICLLLLRGPQTPGELRTRSNRLAEFADVSEVDETLTQLQSLNDEVLVVKLAREAGKRESRYAHLFCQLDEQLISSLEISNSEVSASVRAEGALKRIASLEEQVELLTKQVAELQEIMN